jgi:hypothetical protein
MSSSAPHLVAYIVILVGISFTALLYLVRIELYRATAPVAQAVSTAPDENTVPFSYNVPVDSHMNYKNDVVIVVEHPDDKIAVGVR